MEEEMTTQSEERYESAKPRERLRNNESVTVYRSFLGEGVLVFALLASFLLVRMIIYTIPSTLWETQFFVLLGIPFGFVWSPLECIPLIIVGVILFRIYDERYVIESDAVLRITGLSSIGIRTTEAYLKNVRVIRVEQNWYQTIFGIGDVRVCTSHLEEGDICLRGVANPFQRKALIERRMHGSEEELMA